MKYIIVNKENSLSQGWIYAKTIDEMMAKNFAIDTIKEDEFVAFCHCVSKRGLDRVLVCRSFFRTDRKNMKYERKSKSKAL